MKHDMDLARQILFKVEEAPYNGGPLSIQIDGRSDEEISYHVMQLAKAGFVEAKSWSEFGSWSYQPTYLTWQGHEFLDAARDQNRWGKAKELVLEQSGRLTLDTLRSVLLRLVTGEL